MQGIKMAHHRFRQIRQTSRPISEIVSLVKYSSVGADEVMAEGMLFVDDISGRKRHLFFAGMTSSCSPSRKFRSRAILIAHSQTVQVMTINPLKIPFDGVIVKCRVFDERGSLSWFIARGWKIVSL